MPRLYHNMVAEMTYYLMLLDVTIFLIHKKIIVACLRTKNRKELRELGASTRELLQLTG